VRRDFRAVRAALKTIVAELNHRVLLPTGHPSIRVSVKGREVEAVCGDRRWVFPADNCLLLPLASTTTELLAQYVGQRLLSQLALPHTTTPPRVRIEIDEGSGDSAVCELP